MSIAIARGYGVGVGKREKVTWRQAQLLTRGLNDGLEAEAKSRPYIAKRGERVVVRRRGEEEGRAERGRRNLFIITIR